jgi:hypothetical protein
VLLAVVAANVAAQGTLTGVWRTVVAPGQPRDRMPKTFGEVLLDLKAEGTTLTGTATMDGWPGSAPISDGKIDGNEFSFTWIGTIPSRGGVPMRTSYPRLTFVGFVDGDQKMHLAMDGDYRMDLKGERQPPQ